MVTAWVGESLLRIKRVDVTLSFVVLCVADLFDFSRTTVHKGYPAQERIDALS